jgi:glyoxylase-like metal-dependent hydrolase (beta-lactamase superfamily II)
MPQLLEISKLEDRLYKLVDTASSNSLFPVQSFLVVGDKKAALIDTGLGIGNIKELAETATSLPIIVLHTHGHLDHTGGDPLFEENYISLLEKIPTIAEAEAQQEEKKALASSFPGVIGANLEFVPPAEVSYKPVEDGDAFDLGGITLEAVSIPGHTEGSIAYVDKDGRFALTGDGIADIHWFDDDKECSTVEGFLETLDRFEARAHNAKRYYAAHLPSHFGFDLIRDLQAAAKSILGGSDDPIENSDYLFLKHGDLKANHSGNATIFYKQENIWRARK